MKEGQTIQWLAKPSIPIGWNKTCYEHTFSKKRHRCK